MANSISVLRMEFSSGIKMGNSVRERANLVYGDGNRAAEPIEVDVLDGASLRGFLQRRAHGDDIAGLERYVSRDEFQQLRYLVIQVLRVVLCNEDVLMMTRDGQRMRVRNFVSGHDARTDAGERVAPLIATGIRHPAFQILDLQGIAIFWMYGAVMKRILIPHRG